MKILKEKTFTVKYVVPENDEERAQIKKEIEEAENEKYDLNKVEYKIVDYSTSDD